LPSDAGGKNQKEKEKQKEALHAIAAILPADVVHRGYAAAKMEPASGSEGAMFGKGVALSILFPSLFLFLLLFLFLFL